MDPSTETETVSILRSVCTILKARYGKAVIIKLAACDEKFIADWCEMSFNKLAENNVVPNVTHITDEVDSPNGTENININQNEVSSNAPIDSENSPPIVAREESCSSNNETRKRPRSRSASPTPEEILKKNSSDFKATKTEFVQNLGFDEKRRLMEREKQIDEEIRDKNISGMREKSLLDERSKIRQKIIMIKREAEEVLPILDVIDFGTGTTTAKPCNSSGEPKPFIMHTAKNREGPSPAKIRSPIKVRSTPSPSLHLPTLSEEVDIEVFSDTEITPNNVSLPSTSDISSTTTPLNRRIISTHRRKIQFKPNRPIHVEREPVFEEEHIRPLDEVAPEDAPKQHVVTRQEEICGYKLSAKEYQCSTCSKILASVYSLRNHSAFIHGCGQSYRCGNCRRRFRVEESYRAHLETVCRPRNVYNPSRQRSQSVYNTTF